MPSSHAAAVSFPLFECACVVVVVLTLAAMARARRPGELLREYAALSVAAFVGEDTCVAIYRFYAYAPGWHLRVHHVPLLVPLIWPLVVLSARDVVSSLWPTLGRWRAVAVAALVAFDASLVEVVAVRAGLWSWAEGGHLGVPIIGILGWGYFAFGADLALSSLRARAAVAFAPLAAHALILATWWSVFRWTLRGPLGAASSIGVGAIGVAALVAVVVARRRARSIPLGIAAPRMIAAGLFVALLLSAAPFDGALWAHAVAVAVPYLAATAWSFKGTRSPEGRRGSTAPSRR